MKLATWTLALLLWAASLLAGAQAKCSRSLAIYACASCCRKLGQTPSAMLSQLSNICICVPNA